MFKQSLVSATLALSLIGLQVACVAAPASFSEQQLVSAARLRDAVMQDNTSYNILESLTSEVGARMAGTPADARAVAWAQAKFKALGYDKVWLEPVSFPTWQRGHESAEIVAPFPHRLAVTALGNSIATPESGVRGELVQFATLAALRAAAPESVRGKIVFINHKMGASTEYALVQPGRTLGASEAAAKGALALVIRSVGTDSHRLPHTGTMRYAPDTPKIPAAAMSNPDADLVARLLARGQSVTLNLKLGAQAGAQATSYNVIGEITGSDGSGEYVLIGGHLDSWDLGTGAVDDGAGCAITMAAGAAIKRLGMQPRRSVRVVLFANEEQGLFGAKAYHAAHVADIAKIQAAAEADQGQGPVTTLSSFVRADTLAAVRQMQSVMAPLGVAGGANDARAGPDMGDLRASGMATFALALKSDDYFDLHHTADDTFDKIEPARIRQASAAYAVFAWMAADASFGFGSGQSELKAASALP